MRFAIGLFCLFFAFMPLSACSKADTPEAVAQNFFQALLVKGDIEAVMKTIELDDSSKKQAGARKMIKGKLMAGIQEEKERTAKKGGISGIEIEKTEEMSSENTEMKRVHAIIKYKNGDTKEDSVRVVKTDAGWKIRI